VRVYAFTTSLALFLSCALAIAWPLSMSQSSGVPRRTVNPNVSCTGLPPGPHSFVGGHDGNIAPGTDSGVLSGQNNEACGDQSAIGAGANNVAFGTQGGFIGAGTMNQGGYEGFIGAGNQNVAFTGWDAIFAGSRNRVSGLYGTILGGWSNTNTEQDSFIGGGFGNAVTATRTDAVAGGQSNIISKGAGASFIGGGANNAIGGATSGSSATIFGGFKNSVTLPVSNVDCLHGAGCETIGGGYANQANAFAATVPGGAENIADGIGSFAAGIHSWVANDGAFVWSDDASGATQLKSTASNQFLARASGGFVLYTDPVLTDGVTLHSGSGTWASVSDRRAKRDIAAIDENRVLDAIVSLPITEWTYRSESSVRHIGPMAQDFARAFGLGEDDRHIATIDEAGVALAAVSALRSRLAGIQKNLGVPVRPNTGCSGKGPNSFVGGNDGNVAGGGDTGVLTGYRNQACDTASGIGSGGENLIATTQGAASSSFIGGGFEKTGFVEPNVIGGLGSEAFIGAGTDNSISASDSAIGAGEHNIVSGRWSMLGGGFKNTVKNIYGFLGGGYEVTVFGGYATAITGDLGVAPNTSDVGGNYAFLGDGEQQTVSGDYSAVGGGFKNATTGKYSVIGGGSSNQAGGVYSVVAGGESNGVFSTATFASGTATNGLNGGCFLWGDDSGGNTLSSTATDQFLARADGGYRFYTNSSNTIGATLAPGSGTWASVSDRALKRNIVAADEEEVLDALGRLPISEWSYLSQFGVRHLGPMAQDFYAAFRVGEDDRHIAMLDEDGVVLAAIKALNEHTLLTAAQAAHMEAQYAETNRRDAIAIGRLRARLRALEARALTSIRPGGK